MPYINLIRRFKVVFILSYYTILRQLVIECTIIDLKGGNWHVKQNKSPERKPYCCGIIRKQSHFLLYARFQIWSLVAQTNYYIPYVNSVLRACCVTTLLLTLE